MTTTFVRSNTASRRSQMNLPDSDGDDHNHNHNHNQQQKRQELGWSMRTFSKRVSHTRTRSYRASQRRIFLNSFKLEKEESLRRGSAKCRKLRKLAAEVVKAVDSVLSFLKIGSCRLRTCDGGLALRASEPTPLNERR